MKKINLLLNYLETQTTHYAATNTAISSASVGWHSIHICLVINSITSAVIKSDPKNFKKKFSYKGFIVMLLKKFPRGKATAPSFTKPSSEITANLVLESIAESRKQLELLSSANKDQYFTHPIFGDLQQSDTIKFLGVHTNHHVKIINDILN